MTAVTTRSVRAGGTPGPRPAGRSGWGLEALSVAPALVAAAWLLVALPLLMIGYLRPLPAALLAVPLAVAAVRFTVVRLPARVWPRSASLWVGAITVAFGVLSMLGHAEHVVIRRDAGSYAQIGYWLAQHGSLPVPAHLDAFGGPDPALLAGSPAFYPDGGSVVPQFMSGTPMTLAIGQWLGGWTGLLVVPAVVGALALLAGAGLAARLVGPRWAPVAALALGLTQPVLHAAAATYSEPLAQLVLLAGLCLLADALTLDSTGAGAGGGRGPGGGGGPGGSRGLALVAGGVLGLSLLVRIDAGRELTLLVPVVGWLYATRSRLATPLLAGLVAGAGYGVMDGAVLTRPYLHDISGSLKPMVALFAAAAVVTAVAVPLVRRRSTSLLTARWWRPLPAAAAALVVLTGLLLAARPLFQTVRGNPSEDGANFVAGLQRSLGLPVDRQRLYYENSLHWVAWYVGWPLLALACGGAALLVYRILAGRDRRAWVPALVVVLGSTVLTLWRPGITPDHPWADRRFVPVVLPGLVLLAVFAVATLLRRVSAHWSTRVSDGRRRALVVATAVVGIALVTVPAAYASAPLMARRTEVGEVAAVHRACAAFQPNDVVLLVDTRGKNEWTQVLRGDCGVPTAVVAPADRATLNRLAARARAAGSRPLVATGGSPDPLIALGLRPRQVVTLRTRQDQRVLTERPHRLVGLSISLWTAPAPAF